MVRRSTGVRTKRRSHDRANLVKCVRTLADSSAPVSSILAVWRRIVVTDASVTEGRGFRDRLHRIQERLERDGVMRFVAKGGGETSGWVLSWYVARAFFARSWYEDATQEAKNGRHEDWHPRRREVVFAVAAAETYLFEWTV